MSGDCQAQGVRPPSGYMRLVAGRTVRRTHHRGIALATGTVVVTHFDRTRYSSPLRPVKLGIGCPCMVVGLIAKQGSIVHFLWVYDLSRIQQSGWIKHSLYRLKRANHSITKHHRMKFGSHNSIAMFAGMRSFVLTDHCKGFFSNCPHLADIFRVFHVEYRAYMQAALRSMGIPRAGGAMLRKYLR